jgi:hypothetical protein
MSKQQLKAAQRSALFWSDLWRRWSDVLQPSLPTCPSSRDQHLDPSFSFQTA